ncbi:3897_t:CDS:2 [Entrophospora sp. SA101]|nr:3897_t:CDS:2 [Entrophospora sp. SA101]
MGNTNETDVNPVAVINNLYQQHLRYKTEPRYTATQNKELKFSCVLRFDDQKWSTRQEHMKKRDAKRDVAEQAMIYLQQKYPEQLQRTQRYMVEAFKPEYKPRLENYGKGVQQIASELHWTEMIPNVKKWYDEILKPNFPPCPRTLLHELVQKYNLGVVTYREIKNLPIHDEDPSVKFIVVDVGKRRFNPTSVFDKAQYRYAKDHVAMIAFEILYEEIEYEEKKLIDNMDLDYQRLIGNVIFMEDWKKITPHGSYKNITNYLGVPVEEEVPNDNSDDEVEKITYTTSKTLALLYPSMFSESGHNKTSKPPVTVTITKPTFERSQQRYKPYKPPVERSARPQQHYELHKPILHVDKTFISLIHELADKRHWRKPEYDYHRLADGGCYATLSVNNYMFTGGVYATRHSAKEDVSKETDEQHQKQHQKDAKAHHQQHINNPQLHNFAQDFSEDANVPILHQINVTSSTTCSHCNAFKFPPESPGMCCSNGKISDLPAENIGNLSMVIHAYIPDLDPRTHNAPTASQVVAIWINDDIRQNVVQKCDIVLYTQMDQLIHISELNGCYEPLAYPLFFPHGKQGWAPNQIPYRDIPSVPE